MISDFEYFGEKLIKHVMTLTLLSFLHCSRLSYGPLHQWKSLKRKPCSKLCEIWNQNAKWWIGVKFHTELWSLLKCCSPFLMDRSIISRELTFLCTFPWFWTLFTLKFQALSTSCLHIDQPKTVRQDSLPILWLHWVLEQEGSKLQFIAFDYCTLLSMPFLWCECQSKLTGFSSSNPGFHHTPVEFMPIKTVD